MTDITDERIIDLAVTHSNYRKKGGAGLEYEVISHERIVKFARDLLKMAVPTLPADIVESLLAVGPIEWGATDVQSDEKHVEDFTRTLHLTREHFVDMDEATAMHGLYLEGDVVLAHTGNSPNSPQHARILAGAWNHLVDMALAAREAGR